MDIDVDQGLPRGDLARLPNGKYIYRFSNGKFDVDQFNREFEQYTQKRKDEMDEQIQKKLAALNAPEPPIPAYNLSIGQIVINMKDALFNTLDDLLQFKFKRETFIKNDRLFYLGLTFIILASLIYIYLLFSSKKTATSVNDINIKHDIKMSPSYKLNIEPVVQKKTT
jgi:hypothetical protein